MARDVGKMLNVLAVIGVVGLMGLSMLQGRRSAGGPAGGSCCGGGAWGASLARGGGQGSITSEAEKAALIYARTKLGSTQGITAKAIDYGCHIGVDVYRNGKVVLRLAYRGSGRVEEI